MAASEGISEGKKGHVGRPEVAERCVGAELVRRGDEVGVGEACAEGGDDGAYRFFDLDYHVPWNYIELGYIIEDGNEEYIADKDALVKRGDFHSVSIGEDAAVEFVIGCLVDVASGYVSTN